MRQHELDLKKKLAGPGGMATTKIPLVSVADVEAVVSSWSGVPLQQMNASETSRLNQLEPILKVCCCLNKCFDHCEAHPMSAHTTLLVLQQIAAASRVLLQSRGCKPLQCHRHALSFKLLSF